MFPNGVSNQFISFPAFWALSPYSWTSMYGGRMQFNVMDTTIPENIAYMAQNCLNPFFWAMYNRQRFDAFSGRFKCGLPKRLQHNEATVGVRIYSV